MTIKRLAKLLRTYEVPYLGRYDQKDTSTPFYLNALSGKRVAIEAAGIIYRQNAGAVIRAIENHSFSYTDGRWSRPRDEDVLAIFRSYIRNYMSRLLGSGIVPVVIIEGRGPEMKGGTLQIRSREKANNENKAEDSSHSMDLDTYKHHLRNAYYPGGQHVDIAIKEMSDLGISMLRAHREAEGVCAQLVNDTTDPYHCSCAIIDDYDIFMYDCRAVVRNLRVASDRVGGFEGTAYAHLDILISLDLINMIDGKPVMEDYHDASIRFKVLCILSGTDYHSNIPGIGCGKVLNLLRNKKISLTEITDKKGKFHIHSSLLDNDRIRDLLSLIPDDKRHCPSKITSYLNSVEEVPTDEEYQYNVGDVTERRINTYEDICIIDPRFKSIPYYRIIDTLDQNMGYSII